MKAMGWFVRAVLGILAMLVLLWSASRLWPMPAAQREALARLQEAPGRSGDNAFAALWLLPYEGLLPAQYPALLARDAALQQQAHECRLTAMSQLPEQAAACPGRGDSIAAEQWPTVPRLEPLCRFSDLDCLDKVRADPQTYAAALAPQAALLARIARLPHAGYVHSPFPVDAGTPLPAYSLLQRPLAGLALAHVQGRSDEALAGSCDLVRSGRMLMAGGDNLLAATIGGAMTMAAARLSAQILAELPRTQPLPDTCTAAFAPARVDELNLCNAMRGEFRWAQAAFAQTPPQTGLWLLFDEHKTLGRSALTLGQACSAQTAQTLRADRPVPAYPLPGPVVSLPCAANALGCTLTAISAPAYADYGRRLQDAGAQLHLVQVLLWMRAHAAPDDAGMLLAELPAELRAQGRAIELTADGRQLRMPAYADGSRPAPQVALPPALQPSLR